MQSRGGGSAVILRGTDRMLVMGITGKQGTFWTERMQDYGTRIVGGTNPNKAGTTHCGVPVFATARDAMKGVGFDIATLSPTYRLIVGVPGGSSAIEIAGRLGMDETILDQALELLNRDARTREAHAIERMLADVRRWAQDTQLPDGRRVIDQEWVQLNLARVHARLEFLRLANWKVAWSAAEDKLHPADASTVKVFGTEFYLEAYRPLLEIIGPRGSIKDGSPAAVLHGRLEGMVRGAIILTFGGGTNEIQRDIIAVAGLGMPRPLR